MRITIEISDTADGGVEIKVDNSGDATVPNPRTWFEEKTFIGMTLAQKTMAVSLDAGTRFLASLKGGGTVQ